MVARALFSWETFPIPAPNVSSGGWYRSQMQQYTEQSFDLPLHSWVTDGAAPVPLGTAATTNLGLVGGTFGTNGHSIQSIDEKNNAGAHSAYAVNTFELPPMYGDAGTLQIAVRAGMLTTAASTSAVVDIEAYLLDDDGDPTGSDLCQTAAQSINNLTLATKTFTLDSTSLTAGDKLMIRMTTTVNDTATGTAVIAMIKKTAMLLTTQG
jgi:hypothetical protein